MGQHTLVDARSWLGIPVEYVGTGIEVGTGFCMGRSASSSTKGRWISPGSDLKKFRLDAVLKRPGRCFDPISLGHSQGTGTFVDSGTLAWRGKSKQNYDRVLFLALIQDKTTSMSSSEASTEASRSARCVSNLIR
eukprot:3238073-Amphidinium_carterae.1